MTNPTTASQELAQIGLVALVSGVAAATMITLQDSRLRRSLPNKILGKIVDFMGGIDTKLQLTHLAFANQS